MRGVVSLAAALSIPLTTNAGEPVPQRALILFIAFIVILVTLVFQGSTLPWVIRKVNLEDKYTAIPEQKQEMIIQKKMAHVSLKLLEEKHGNEHLQNEYLRNLSDRLKLDLVFFNRDPEEIKNSGENTLKNFQFFYFELLDAQRKLLNEMNHRAEFDEELIRKYLSLIDLEEMKIREKIIQETVT